MWWYPPGFRQYFLAEVEGRITAWTRWVQRAMLTRHSIIFAARLCCRKKFIPDIYDHSVHLYLSHSCTVLNIQGDPQISVHYWVYFYHCIVLYCIIRYSTFLTVSWFFRSIRGLIITEAAMNRLGHVNRKCAHYGQLLHARAWLHDLQGGPKNWHTLFRTP